MADQTYKVTFEGEDKVSPVVKQVAAMIDAFKMDAKPQQLGHDFRYAREQASQLGSVLRGGLSPAMSAMGLSTFTVAGAVAGMASAFHRAAQGIEAYKFRAAEMGTTIDTVHRAATAAARKGASDPLPAMQALSTLMLRIRAGAGGVAEELAKFKQPGVDVLVGLQDI